MTERWGIRGSSVAIERLREEIRILAPLEATVLIRGETGTGKGLVARALHRASQRKEQPFVHVDCAALAPTVIESELFGHERGAFTGAHRTQLGRLEAAGRGTLFLDEIGEIALPLQAKLLRVLQDRVFERVGAVVPRRFEARVVAATHCDLDAAVHAGTFRADLFYRLNVVRLDVPPLRERIEDLGELVAGHPANVACVLDIANPALLTPLRERPWPGNVRELFNWLERHAVEMQLREHVDPPVGVGPMVSPTRCRTGGDAWPTAPEGPLVADTLREVGGNVSRAARRLGMSRSALRRRIHRYGLDRLIPRD